jgi:zinc protease
MHTKKYFLVFIIFCVSALWAGDIPDVNIPYTKFVLKNGLTVIVHEDHKAPIVAVNIWYHVGSKNEKPGKTGFAHLFEHLMFNGSENFNDDYFQAMERIGATDLNGTTGNDRTNYFQNVPVSALDEVLWLESDRMGHLIGAITQGKLDEQRGVVQNEKRQGDNEPYAISEELITENTYPKGHPYSWTVIGSMDDLNAASLNDVHEWFKKYYGPNNAVLAIAGDVNAEDVKKRVEKFFGDIPPSPPFAKHETWVAKMSGVKRQIAQDRVPQARLYKVWNVPELGNKELSYLDLLSDVLSQGKTSRLYKRLVYDEQIATDAYAYYNGGEIGSQFFIVANAKPGVELSVIEKAIDEELNKLLKDGPSNEELDRVKTNNVANFLRGIERIGGFGGKSDILAQNEVFNGSADYYKTTLNFVKNATTKDLKDAAVKWLSDGEYILEIHPYPEYSTTESNVDRSKLPVIEKPADTPFPSFETAKLENGLKIIVARRPALPLVNFNLIVNGGYSADKFAKPGTASMMMSMMDEGTKSRDALTLNDDILKLGAGISASASLDAFNVNLSSIKSNLSQSLELYSDIVLNPSFPEQELARLKQQRINQIKNEKSRPFDIALRVLPVLLYGKGHAYGAPLTGSGYEADVENINVKSLSDFHNIWFKPNNATLVIVGDISLAEVKPYIEKAFGNWKSADVPNIIIPEVSPKEKPVIYFIDKPQAEQSIILAGHITTPRSDPDNIAVESMNTILGGAFTSRINMNLREDKHWSYGSGSFIRDAKGQRPFIVYGLVQTDKTKEAIIEISKELKGIISDKPATEQELDKVKSNLVLSLPGSWETNSAVASSLREIVTYNLPDNYFNTYASKVRELNLNQINNTAKRIIKPGNLTWAVVGDRAKVYDSLKQLGYDIKLIDVDGNIIEETNTSIKLKTE